MAPLPNDQNLKHVESLQIPGDNDRLKSEMSISISKGKRKIDPIISSKNLQKTHTETILSFGQMDDSPRDQAARPVYKATFNDLRFLVGMDEWQETVLKEGLSK